MTVTASLLSASPPTSNSIFLVGFLEGMKSLFPTTQPMGGKSLWAQKGESIRSVPLPCDPQKLLALRVTASATPVGVSHQRPPAPAPPQPGADPWPVCESLCVHLWTKRRSPRWIRWGPGPDGPGNSQL